MRIPSLRALTIAFLLLLTGRMLAFEPSNPNNCAGNFLNIAILELPPKYLAGVSLNNRIILLKVLSGNPADDRLDYPNGYLNYYTDSDEGVNASSQFWIKILKRPHDTPLVFVSFFPDPDQKRSQIFVLERTDKGWADVSSRVLPKKLKTRNAFLPMRRRSQIGIVDRSKKGPWRCEAALRWTGERLEKISIPSWDCGAEDHSLYVWDGDQKELNFDGRVFQTVAELKKQFETLPPGSHIFCDFGLQVPKELPLKGEPKMSMEAFKDFCASRRITLDISTCTQ